MKYVENGAQKCVALLPGSFRAYRPDGRGPDALSHDLEGGVLAKRMESIEAFRRKGQASCLITVSRDTKEAEGWRLSLGRM